MHLFQVALFVALSGWANAQDSTDQLCHHDRQNYKGYYIDCNTGSVGDNFDNDPDSGNPAATLQECINRCNAKTGCTGVSHQNNVENGNCYLIQTFTGTNPAFPEYDIAVKLPNNNAPAAMPWDIGNSYKYYNCLVDTDGDGAISDNVYTNAATSLEDCAAACNAYDTAGWLGMTKRQECFCGPTLDTAGGNSTGCTLPCQQNTKEICGGTNAAQIYIRDGYAVALSKTSVSVSRSAANAAIASTRDSINADKSTTLASILSSKTTFASLVTSSRYEYSRQQATLRASITSRRDDEASSRAEANLSVSKSRDAYYSDRSSLRASVSAQRDADATSRAEDNALRASSRADAADQKASTRASILQSKSARDASIASTKASVAASRSVANAANAATRASVASSKAAARASRGT